MKDIKNRVELNIINDYGDEWFGITFEAWKIKLSKDELLYKRKINILDELIGVDYVHGREDCILVGLYKDQYENVFDTKYLKEVIDKYIDYLKKSIDKAGIEEEYSILFEFFNDYGNYDIKVRNNQKEGI
ncbi:Uncharacterised protein [uncultured Clostridium sp.]|uniref:hypothetical protein n=1 Tax=uncultured Clostridium sp. TaxID=59620 RepID=UPI000820BC68|nr:hypothetical protein [uncultured Clostridium sp.]SCK02045.1 Uncharacterised protein [uncultured Clostridium sp.]